MESIKEQKKAKNGKKQKKFKKFKIFKTKTKIKTKKSDVVKLKKQEN